MLPYRPGPVNEPARCRTGTLATVKLCRFELLDEPGQTRSGIFHDSRVYETHGMKAVGIHDLAKVAFLSPVPRPPSLRMFEVAPGGSLFFHYLNPSALAASGAEVLPAKAGSLAFEVRIGVVAQDGGESLGEEEAEGLVLGLLPVVTLRMGLEDPVAARDLPVVAGPFLVTDEDLPSPLALDVSVDIGGKKKRFEGLKLPVSPGAVLARSSRGVGLTAGDLALSPALAGVGGSLGPGEELTVAVEPLGAVRLRA